MFRSIAAAADYLSTINLALFAMELRAQDVRASNRPGDAGYLHRIRSATRNDFQPHDVIVDAEGIVWYSSFGEQYLGKLDPQQRKGHGISDSRAQTVPNRDARPAH